MSSNDFNVIQEELHSVDNTNETRNTRRSKTIAQVIKPFEYHEIKIINQ